MFLKMEGDSFFSSLLYSICEVLSSFFSPETLKKIFSDYVFKNMSVVSFSIKKTRFWVDGEWNRP